MEHRSQTFYEHYVRAPLFRGSKEEDSVKELEDEVLKEVELVGCNPPHWKRLLPWQLVMMVVNLFKVRPLPLTERFKACSS